MVPHQAHGRHHLAQVNVGKLVAPLDDPRIDDFRDNLERINLLAEAQPGFVWRAVGTGFDATDLRPFEDQDLLVNASVWESLEALAAFAYRTDHKEFVRRRHEWFQPSDQPTLVVWWLPAGETPPLEDCVARLDHLRAHGPTAHAFDFKTRFPAPAVAAAVG